MLAYCAVDGNELDLRAQTQQLTKGRRYHAVAYSTSSGQKDDDTTLLRTVRPVVFFQYFASEGCWKETRTGESLRPNKKNVMVSCWTPIHGVDCH